ncbi:hypothetical protein ACFL4T_08975 [candidate division KSB1 bacterium]
MKKLILICLLILISCNTSTKNSDQEGEKFKPRWARNIPLINERVSSFDHDNRIYETEHILTYGDEVSDESKIWYAEMAEQAYFELKTLFYITETDNFGIKADGPETKIQIILNKNDPRSQRSFTYGFMLYSLDSPYCFANEDNFYNEVKHELTHVFHMYFDGTSRRYPLGWFREGLAEYAADGGFFPQITSLSQFHSLKDLLDDYNMHPLKITWSMLTDKPGEVHSACYSMSHLAMSYLLDPQGLGKSILDIKHMLIDVKNEVATFEMAFNLYFGIYIDAFENDFYDLMESYLN